MGWFLLFVVLIVVVACLVFSLYLCLNILGDAIDQYRKLYDVNKQLIAHVKIKYDIKDNKFDCEYLKEINSLVN